MPTIQEPDICCKKCVFFTHGLEQFGYCRFNPPTVVGGVATSGPAGMQSAKILATTVWPQVGHFDLCSKFERVKR